MQHLEVSGAIRPIYGSLGVRRLICRSVVTVEREYGTCQARSQSDCKVRKLTLISIPPSVRLTLPDSHWTEFCEIMNLELLSAHFSLG